MPIRIILPTESYLGNVRPSWSRWFLNGAMEPDIMDRIKGKEV